MFGGPFNGCVDAIGWKYDYCKALACAGGENGPVGVVLQLVEAKQKGAVEAPFWEGEEGYSCALVSRLCSAV